MSLLLFQYRWVLSLKNRLFYSECLMSLLWADFLYCAWVLQFTILNWLQPCKTIMNIYQTRYKNILTHIYPDNNVDINKTNNFLLSCQNDYFPSVTLEKNFAKLIESTTVLKVWRENNNYCND